MKKLFLIFSILVFQSSFLQAQDTVLLTSGQKIAGKIAFITKRKVSIIEDSDKRRHLISPANITYIKHEGNVKYSCEGLVAKFDTIENPYYHNPITINMGIGISTISTSIPNTTTFELLTPLFGFPSIPECISITPDWNCNIDYAFFKFLSIGLGAGYQSLTDYPGYPGTANTSAETWVTEQITNYTVSGRILLHAPQRSFSDLYVGLAIGESMWTEKIVAYNSGFGPLTPTFTGTIYDESIRLLLGYRLFPTNNFGFHFEIGMGNPYFLEGGITFRFKTKK